MPGQLGNVRVTTQNLIVVDVRPDENLIMVRGAVRRTEKRPDRNPQRDQGLSCGLRSK